MPPQLQRPIIYLITSGATTSQTTPDNPEFLNILRLVKAAVEAQVSLVQLREKSLTARVLFELVVRAVQLTAGSATRLMVNDRLDVALAAGADGVQLTNRSVRADVVRKTCVDSFLIGVSTHSLDEARMAQGSADLVLFGPVFETDSKRSFGDPQGLGRLKDVTRELNGLPVIAIGGVSKQNAHQCFAAGAAGVAAISMLSDAESISSIVK